MGVIRFGAFEAELESGELRKHGLRIKLQPKSFEVLRVLLERPGELVTRADLQERLWPEDTFVEFDNNLNHAMSRLREALGDSTTSPRFIETVPRRGYRFVAPVEGVPADAPALRRRWPKPLGVSLAILASLLVYRVLEPPSHPIDSVAVLPFVTAGAAEGSTDDYVAFGMTEALIAELSRVPTLKVISQTSVLRYKGAQKPLPAIASELGVGAVVEGSVVREGDQVRITVQLIDATSDTHLWAQTYRRDAENVLATQGALAQSVAREIGARLTNGAEPPSLRPTPPVDPEVHETYLKGRFFLRSGTESGRRRARGYLEEVLAIDPDHALAHAALADYYILTDDLPAEVAVPRAKTHARRALELDHTLADAHVSLGFIHYYGDWDWVVAEREFQRALELNPGHSRARRWYGMYLVSMGRAAEGLDQIQRALELDPLSVIALDSAGQAWFHARRPDRAIEQGNKILELSPNNQLGFEHVGSNYFQSERYDLALEAFQKGLAASDRDPVFLCLVAQAHGALGQRTEAEAAIEELDRIAQEKFVPPWFFAIAHVGAGDPEQALSWLEKGYAIRDPFLVLLKVSPWMDPIRSDPRFQDMLRRMNL